MSVQHDATLMHNPSQNVLFGFGTQKINLEESGKSVR